jgi:hypothetical protein
MSGTYEGTFSVKNCSGEKLYYVSVLHHVDSVLKQVPNDSYSLSADSLADGASITNGKLYSESGVPDLWDIRFEVVRPAWGGGGQTVSVRYTRLNKQCNFGPEDAGKDCVIELRVGSFSILTPVSSPCVDNYIHKS